MDNKVHSHHYVMGGGNMKLSNEYMDDNVFAMNAPKETPNRSSVV